MDTQEASFDETQDKFEKAYTKALKFLNYRPRSEKEVRDNLVKKKIDPDFINGIIELLKKQKFLDDVAFARMWIESRMRAKPRAVRVLKMELRLKGIADDIIEPLLQEEDANSDLEMAKSLIEKKLPRLQKLPEEEVKIKLGQLLGRKGFNWDTIRQAVDEVLKKEV